MSFQFSPFLPPHGIIVELKETELFTLHVSFVQNKLTWLRTSSFNDEIFFLKRK